MFLLFLCNAKYLLLSLTFSCILPNFCTCFFLTSLLKCINFQINNRKCDVSVQISIVFLQIILWWIVFKVTITDVFFPFFILFIYYFFNILEFIEKMNCSIWWQPPGTRLSHNPCPCFTSYSTVPYRL